VALNTIKQANNLIEVTQISAVKIVVIFISIDDLNIKTAAETRKHSE
jgi:hypothetical protein